MNNLQAILTATLLAGFMAHGLHAEPRPQFTEKQIAQQQRMIDCNIEAKKNGLKGADYQAFMKTCLSGGTVTAEVGSASASASERPAEPGGRQR